MFSIVEVCKKTNLSSRTLRVWEEEGLLKGTRNPSGMRIFDYSVFETIDKIQRLKEFGFTLKDIQSILRGSLSIDAAEVLRNRQSDIEKQTIKLLEIQRKLSEVEELLNESALSRNSADLCLSPKTFKSNYTASVLRKSSFSESKIHKDHLEAELSGLHPDEVVTWFAKLKKIKRIATEEQIPTRFVRGYAASSLSLHLAGWTNIDPCAEGLIPHSPNMQDLHFDVPYSGCEKFFDSLNEVNEETKSCRFVAFRLPVLDILNEFASNTGINLEKWESEAALIERLAQGDVEYVFAVDESGGSLLNRIYPELTETQRSVTTTREDIKRFSPKKKDDVLRFLALRREKTWKHFQNYLKGQAHETPDCVLARAISKTDRGYVFFREDMLAAIKKVTGWDWLRISKFRQDMRNNSLSEENKIAFESATDSASLEYFKYWDELYFHKAHLVGWWQLIAATLTCKMKDPSAWERVIRTWEDKHGLLWNDFGVIWRDAKLLTPL